MSTSDEAQRCKTDYTHKTQISHQTTRRLKYLLIVALAHTRAEPHAMMIELHHTYVAHVAMRAPRRPEPVARLTEFELENNRRMCLVHLQVKNTVLTTDIVILIRQVALHFVPAARRDNAWVA